jgi:hypothetical protein
MSAMLIPKATIIRSKRIRNFAKGKPCTVRGPTCNRDPDTSVWAHSPFRAAGGGGMAFKVSDIYGCIACSECHRWLDQRLDYDGPSESRTVAYHRAQDRSLQMLLDAGIVVVK